MHKRLYCSIIYFEEWVKKPKETIEDILKFLGLDTKLDDFDAESFNEYFKPSGLITQHIRQSKLLRPVVQKMFSPSTRLYLRNKFIAEKTPKPEMDKKDRDFLIAFYKDDVKKVENILGRKLPWLNF